MNKDDIIYHVKNELEGMGMFLILHDKEIYKASFIYNKYDRKRAHIRLNPDLYETAEFIASALHELGHARMYHKYSTVEYYRNSNEWHELGAWNIALREAEKLSIKLPKEHIIKCLQSYHVGIDTIEGMLEPWNNSLFSLSYA